MTRIARALPELLDPDQRALYDAIASGPRAQGPQHFALKAEDGGLLGPFNALLLSPALGTALQSVGSAVRFQTDLTERCRELAILTVAAAWDSAFERASHESVGRAAGLTEDELRAVASGADVGLDDPTERAVVDACRALIAGDLSDAEWERFEAELGATTIFELTTLVGYYATLALQLRVFRVDERES